MREIYPTPKKLNYFSGRVLLNGKVELQRGKKLVDGDIVEFEGHQIKIKK